MRIDVEMCKDAKKKKKKSAILFWGMIYDYFPNSKEKVNFATFDLWLFIQRCSRKVR